MPGPGGSFTLAPKCRNFDQLIVYFLLIYFDRLLCFAGPELPYSAQWVPCDNNAG